MIVVSDLVVEGNLAKTLRQSTLPQTVWAEVLHYTSGYLSHR